MYLLGVDIGSSSVKVSLIDGENGNCVASSFHPKQEMKIIAHKAGWAEQEQLPSVIKLSKKLEVSGV